MRTITRRSTIKERAKDNFRVYDDIADFAREVATTPANPEMFSSGWYGGINWQEAVAKCRDGAPEMVAASDALMSRMDDITAPRPVWEHVSGPVGTTINWGAYHAGAPNISRRRVKTTGDFTPLTIVVDLTVSGSIDSATMIKRGTAILALARLLCGVRPVTLYAMCSTAAGHNDKDGCYSLIQVPASPLDLSAAAYALAHPAFVRGLCYGTARHFHQFKRHWPYCDHGRPYIAGIRTLLEGVIPGAADCLYIPSLHSKHDPEVTDPVQWVKDMIAKHGTPQEA